jgi:DNA-binding MarR family transcriptional regulator
MEEFPVRRIPLMDLQPQSSTPLLEKQLRELISYFDALTQRLAANRPSTAISELELSRHESRVIMLLGSKGATTMSEMARVLNLALSTATNTMDKLVSKELVERARVDEDRRVVQVGLSEKGRRIYEAFLGCQHAMGRRMLEALSPGEREIFLELMAKMTQPSQGSTDSEMEHSLVRRDS